MIDKVKLEEELFEIFASSYHISKDDVKDCRLIQSIRLGGFPLYCHFLYYKFAIRLKTGEIHLFDTNVRIEDD